MKLGDIVRLVDIVGTGIGIIIDIETDPSTPLFNPPAFEWYRAKSGLIVELTGQSGWNRDPGYVLIMFANNTFMKFHESQLKIIYEN
jgi:hypothetical protein